MRFWLAVVLVAVTGLAHGQQSVATRAFGVQVPPGCDRTVDSDGDGLPDCVETNTGVYKSRLDTGTDPHNPDSDGDGISDKDEVYGVPGVPLSAMGLNPNHKDLLVEEHWFDESLDCGAFHSHRLSDTQHAAIVAFYAGTPLRNRDGKNGIHVVFDYGQGGPFTHGGLVPQGLLAIYGEINEGVYGADFQALRTALFDPRRQGYFHFYVGAHDYLLGGSRSSSGNATIDGFELLSAMACNNSGHPEWTVATFLHEMGHNLNLNHGGDQACNWKPNYNSIMNYRYQFQGVDDNCDGHGEYRWDYSDGVLAPLDEHHLNEQQGLCHHVPIDWNNDGQYSTDLAFDLNAFDTNEANVCGGTLSVLHDFNDWSRITLYGVRLNYDVPPAPAGETNDWGIERTSGTDGRMTLRVHAPHGVCLPDDVSSQVVDGILVVTLSETDACENTNVRAEAAFVKPAQEARRVRLDVCQVNPTPMPTTCATVAGD